MAREPRTRLTRRRNPIEEDILSGLEGARPREEEFSLLGGLPIDEFQSAPDISSVEALAAQERIPFQQPPQQRFRQQVGQEVAQAREAFAEQSRQRGVIDRGQLERFEERGVQIGGRLVAQQEFDEAVTAQNNAIEEMVKTANLRDKQQENILRNDLQVKFNKARAEVLKRAAFMERQLAKQKLSAQKKMALAGAFGKIAGAVIGGAVAGPVGSLVGAGTGGSVGRAAGSF